MGEAIRYDMYALLCFAFLLLSFPLLVSWSLLLLIYLSPVSLPFWPCLVLFPFHAFFLLGVFVLVLVFVLVCAGSVFD